MHKLLSLGGPALKTEQKERLFSITGDEVDFSHLARLGNRGKASPAPFLPF
jgi:hypothetical protein